MARPLRIQYANAVYHVTCRGNDRRRIFEDDDDRQRFLTFLAQSLTIYSVRLHAFVLMENHFHLLVETPLANLAEFMRKFNITYTGYYNRRHKRTGHLYQGRYKSLLVDKNAYLSVLSRYIHLNPVRTEAQDKTSVKEKIDFLNHYVWSSLSGYLNPKKRENFVDCQLVLSEFGGDHAGGRKAYAKALYTEMAGDRQIRGRIIGQCVIGGKEFIGSITEKFLKGEKDRERPSLKKIRTYLAEEVITRAIEEETGKDIQAVIKEKGVLRQITMDLLYRLGGVKGKEIGDIMGVGYTSVSQERRRLRERVEKDRKLERLFKRIEEKCHQ